MKAKRIIRVCALLLLTVLLAVPAFATAQPTSSGLGYQTGIIEINNKEYDATLTLGGSVSNGGYSIFMTDVYCNRTHYGVTVRFDTFGSGYQVFTGSTRIITLSGTSRSYYTKYQGKDTPLGIYTPKNFGGDRQLRIPPFFQIQTGSEIVNRKSPPI